MRTLGEIEAAICEGISRFEQEYMGRGPKDIRAHLIDDILLVRLQGVLTAAEQHLVKSLPAEKGRDLLKEVRKHLLENLWPLMEAIGSRKSPASRFMSMHHDTAPPGKRWTPPRRRREESSGGAEGVRRRRSPRGAHLAREMDQPTTISESPTFCPARPVRWLIAGAQVLDSLDLAWRNVRGTRWKAHEAIGSRPPCTGRFRGVGAALPLSGDRGITYRLAHRKASIRPHG